MDDVTTVSRSGQRVTTVEEFWETVVIRRERRDGGWSGRQLAVVLGISQSKSTQAGKSAFEKVAICFLAEPSLTLETIINLARDPTPAMLDIIERRDRRLAESCRADRGGPAPS